ncbi:hypothetical protein EVAR_9891_1 [Eumeta japonica]|uniref:Uncharacterized protein n=1 Tax=Eumeta variegata TaxID=151549 RepID=A0A4C1TQB7_EUMVA|nr:hypothetical protein EVAR_9891_1 [Eumeta japonica]
MCPIVRLDDDIDKNQDDGLTVNTFLRLVSAGDEEIVRLHRMTTGCDSVITALHRSEETLRVSDVIKNRHVEVD